MQALLEVLVGSHEDHRAFLAVALASEARQSSASQLSETSEVQAERLDEPMDGDRSA